MHYVLLQRMSWKLLCDSSSIFSSPCFIISFICQVCAHKQDTWFQFCFALPEDNDWPLNIKSSNLYVFYYYYHYATFFKQELSVQVLTYCGFSPVQTCWKFYIQMQIYTYNQYYLDKIAFHSCKVTVVFVIESKALSYFSLFY